MLDRNVDYCTPDGAKLLSEVLAAWWRDHHPHGYLTKFWTEEVRGTVSYLCVRSNLVGGLPPPPPGETGVVIPPRFRIGF